MPNVTCYVGEFNVRPTLPLGSDLSLQGSPIADYFAQASMLASGGPAISLGVDYSRRDSLQPTGGGDVDGGQLEMALAQLLGSAGSSSDHTVGLILTNTYKDLPDAYYGLMFDTAGDSAIGPRQGCAIFLEKIYGDVDAHGNNDQGFRDLVAYTAIHELGHAFNLWHVQDASSFMVANPDDFMKSFTFSDDEKAYLRFAADADPDHWHYVMPGWSNFDDRGPIGVPHGDVPAAKTAPPLVMEIGLSQQDFWHFEPVELEVRLRAQGEKSRKLAIPNVIDPGHGAFEIWITRPDGERHRYQPSMRFCAAPTHRRIGGGEAFERDISIFRQSRGYTFRMPGRYQIEAQLRLSPSEFISSNKAEFEVRRSAPDLEVFAAMRAAMSTPAAVRFLRYKRRLPHREDFVRLKHFAESHPATAATATIHYALGRGLTHMAALEANARRSASLRSEGATHLTIARDHSLLSEHRRRIANSLL
jgi:hypothetical protein